MPSTGQVAGMPVSTSITFRNDGGLASSTGEKRRPRVRLAVMGLLGQFLRFHDAVYKGTNGWIGHHFPPLATSLLLHTVGAKTGQQRTTSLSYARDGDEYLVVASKGGDPKAPGWYHNLKANPNVEINVGPKRFGVTAQPVLPSDADYARLW